MPSPHRDMHPTRLLSAQKTADVVSMAIAFPYGSLRAVKSARRFWLVSGSHAPGGTG